MTAGANDRRRTHGVSTELSGRGFSVLSVASARPSSRRRVWRVTISFSSFGLSRTLADPGGEHARIKPAERGSGRAERAADRPECESSRAASDEHRG
jgi:hypothetical protein